jgi:hypothetical protein
MIKRPLQRKTSMVWWPGVWVLSRRKKMKLGKEEEIAKTLKVAKIKDERKSTGISPHLSSRCRLGEERERAKPGSTKKRSR